MKVARESRVRLAIIAFSGLYIAGFGVWFLVSRNEEFFAYMMVVLAVLGILVVFGRWFALPDYVLGLLSFAGLMHVAGGGVRTADGQVLYAYHIVRLMAGSDAGLYILRYDQVVHAFGYGVIALVIWHILKKRAPGLAPSSRAIFAALAAMGIGSLNEVVEFLAVVGLPHTSVGDYYNNSLDLVFNMLGSTLAAAGAFFVSRFYGKKY